MRRGTVLALLALLAATCMASAANALSFSFERLDGRLIGLDLIQIVYADGEIVEGDAERLRSLYNDKGLLPPAHIYLNSPGGSLVEGIKLGRVIRELHFHTHVGRPRVAGETGSPAGICMSACSLAFLGGEYRYLDEKSVYGVHRFYSNQAGALSPDDAQLVSGVLVSYIQEMNADPALFTYMTTVGGDSILPLPLATLKKLNVVTGNIKSTTWELVNRQGDIYLRAQQDEVRGVNKLLFLCDHHALGMMAMLNSSAPEQVVNWSASWFIDDKIVPFTRDEDRTAASADKSYVDKIVTLITPARLSQLLSAQTVGVAFQPSNPALYAGFSLRMEAGREKLAEFARTCVASR